MVILYSESLVVQVYLAEEEYEEFRVLSLLIFKTTIPCYYAYWSTRL